MIIGRSNMPDFAGTTLDVRQQAAVALYVELLQKPPSPGGWGLGYIGPVTEGLAASAASAACSWRPCGWPGARDRSTRRRPHRRTPRRRPRPTSRRRSSSQRPPRPGPTPRPARAHPFLPTPTPRRRPPLRAPAPGWPAAIGLLVAIAGAVCFVTFFIRRQHAQRLGGTHGARLPGTRLRPRLLGPRPDQRRGRSGTAIRCRPSRRPRRSRRPDRRRRPSTRRPPPGLSRARPAWRRRRPTSCRPNSATSSRAARTCSRRRQAS